MNTKNQANAQTQSHYKIILQGRVGAHLFGNFDSLHISHGEQNTVLSGIVRDQAELQALLNRIFNLNIKMIALYRVSESDMTDLINSSDKH